MSAQDVTLDRLATIQLPGTFEDALEGLAKVALALTDLQAAAAEVDPEPSDAQKDAGNYKKGHVRWKGLGLTIESAKGQYRRGVTKDGTPWQTKMTAHYGYIKRTLSAADGDHIDIFLCEDDLDSEIVFIVDQVEPSTGEFDEHKIILGTTNAADAEALYLSNYQAGWKGLSDITAITLIDFKEWLDAGDSSKPFARSTEKSRLDKHAGVQDLASDEDTLLCEDRHQLQMVRGERYSRLQKMAQQLRGFLCRHGSEAGRADTGAEKSAEELQSSELLLGHAEGSSSQSVNQSNANASGQDLVSSGVGGATGHQSRNAAPTASIRLDDSGNARHICTSLTEYDCPKCGGTVYNGDPETGVRWRGSGKCVDCGHSLSIVASKLQPRMKQAFDEYELELMEKRAKLLPTTTLRPHQEEIAATGLEPQKRMLLYHSLGSGKSLSSLAAAETAGDPYTAVTPASLRPNYRKEQEKFTDMETPSQLVSYNAVASGGVAPTDTILFDEAQRMRNPESLTTQHATELADQAKHVYLLSGTPVVNHPRDLAPMIRMLTGKSFSPEEFDQKFIDERKISPGLLGWMRGVHPIRVPQMKNKDEFEDLLRGHVHYYAPDKPDVERKEEHVVTEMGPEQIKLYKAFWNQLPWIYRWKLQNSYPLTRQEMTRLSSFLSGPRQVGLSTYPFMRGRADPLRAFNQSPKLQRAVTDMTAELDRDPNARGVAFSNFIDAGLSPYAAALKQRNIPYGIFHGGLSDGDRKRVVDDYNNNRIRALLLGPSGGEGISLKGTRLLQILDPHWNSARTSQAVGRGIRYDSHSDLPIQDRNIRVQRYISQLPPSRWQRMWRSVFGNRQDEDARRTTPGADTYLEQLAARKDNLNEQFLRELQRIGTMDKQSADEAAEALAAKMQDADRVFTVAVDLDGTLAETITPHDPERIGELRPQAKKWMDKFREAGARIIIFTVRGDEDLVGDWLDENDVPYDYINENPDQPPDSSGKVIADLYLDDRAVDASGDWDDHGDLVLQRVKAAFSVGTAAEDTLDLFVSELVDARRTLGSPAAMAV